MIVFRTQQQTITQFLLNLLTPFYTTQSCTTFRISKKYKIGQHYILGTTVCQRVEDLRWLIGKGHRTKLRQQFRVNFPPDFEALQVHCEILKNLRVKRVDLLRNEKSRRTISFTCSIESHLVYNPKSRRLVEVKVYEYPC